MIQFDCGHFKKANTWLKQRYGPEGAIDWSLIPGPPPAAVAQKPKAKEVDDEFPFDGEFPDEEELLGTQEKGSVEGDVGISAEEEEAAAAGGDEEVMGKEGKNGDKGKASKDITVEGGQMSSTTKPEGSPKK